MKEDKTDLLYSSFRYCSKIATGHYENFPVGSWIIPREKRKYVHAIYAFARRADDFADENPSPLPSPLRGEGWVRGGFSDEKTYSEEERLNLLEDWNKRLEECIRAEPEDPIFIALKETIKRHDIPVELLKDLIAAFKMDIVNRRYQKVADLLTYCRYSANPVGRIVLHLFGYKDPELHRLSDFICTALQLTNFWQDIAIDLEKDRIYLPLEDMEQFGYTAHDLGAHVVNDAFRNLLASEIGFTRGLFRKGLPICNMVETKLSLELKAVWSGGMKILDKIEDNGYDVFNKRPVITMFDKVKIVSKAFVM